MTVSDPQHWQRETSRAGRPEASRIGSVSAGRSEASRIGGAVGVWDAAEVASFKPVAVAFEVDDLSVVDETIDHGRRDGVVAEDFTPAAEGFVGAHDHAGPFVSGRHQLEEQVGGLPLEG